MDTPLKQLSAPVLLSTSVAVLSGNTAIADTGALSTLFRRPFWIDDVRWAVSAAFTGGVSTRVRTKLKLGRIALSDRFIPLENYAPFLNDFCENRPGTDGSLYSQFRWKLPKPLFVPAGMTLVSEFSRLDGLVPSSVQVDVAYAGRYMPDNTPQPKEIDVPWVTMFEPAAGFTFAQSSELDLYNPFLVPLEVQRFLFANASSTVVDPNIVALMKDSHGQNVFRDFTPTGEIFDINRRAWTFGRVLDPKERYNITLQNLTPGNLDNYTVSIVGTRKERMR